MSGYIHPPTFIKEIEQQNNLLQSARNLLRAKQQELVDLNLYFNLLSDALQAYTDSEFDDWCLEVDSACMQLLGGNQTDSLSSHHEFEWEYSTYFNQGLTIDQAASILQQHLIDSY